MDQQQSRISADDQRGTMFMRWDRFVKLVEKKGFTYVPSSNGSSVRFDPPDEKDPPVMFHKPHPDSTIHPVMLREFSKKLERLYGWSIEGVQHSDPKTPVLTQQQPRSLGDEQRGTAAIRWDRFVKLMEKKGFTYVPSSSGSSVRFDPPDERDPPAMFHKPYPDSTIHPVMMKEFSKKLERLYGWTIEDLQHGRA